MGKLKSPILILGEGITEFFYFNSLKDSFRDIQIEPDRPKNSSLSELEIKIDNAINNGYQKIFCVIDMDNKKEENERRKYQQMRKKYAEPISKPKNGIYCEVYFFETHPCTELFFLYYFAYTSKPFSNQPDLLKELNKHCKYEKTRDFFLKCKGLHSYFEKNGGSLEDAIKNAEQSISARKNGERDYTFSELGEMLKEFRK